jgi:ribonuclease HII
MARRPTNDPRRTTHDQQALLSARRKTVAPSWEHERWAQVEGFALIAGVDEAGRGPLAGPVVAAAVILPPELSLPGLADSKQLAAEQREVLFEAIVAHALAIGVCRVDAPRIDAVNILRATHEAMGRALHVLPVGPAFALVDGLPVHGLPCPHRAIVSGDALCVSIAAAAIIAKVLRDRYMVTLDREYPGYNLARNKGYPTPDHLEALRRRGPCRIHRRSFRPVADACPPAPPPQSTLFE